MEVIAVVGIAYWNRYVRLQNITLSVLLILHVSVDEHHFPIVRQDVYLCCKSNRDRLL